MIKFITLLAIVVVAAPAPVDEPTLKKLDVIPILRYESDQERDGSYSFLFESGDGSSRKEDAVFSNKGTDEEAIKVTGSYTYTDSEGQEIVVRYTADENGFVPFGTNIAKEISDAALGANDASDYLADI